MNRQNGPVLLLVVVFLLSLLVTVGWARVGLDPASLPRQEPPIAVVPEPIQMTLGWSEVGTLGSVLTNHLDVDYLFRLVELEAPVDPPPDQAEILLLGAGVVDDPAGWTMYRDALISAGMTWIEWNLDTRDFPTSVDLAPFSIVIVFAESLSAFHNDNSQILADWLISGDKRLFASGVDWLWNLEDGAPGQGRHTLYQLFHTEYEGQHAGSDIPVLEGVAADPIGGDFAPTNSLNLSRTAGSNGNYADASQSLAVAGLQYGVGGAGAEYAGLTHYDGGTYRTVWLGVNYHNGLTDQTQRNQLMANILDFFLGVDIPWYGVSIPGGLVSPDDEVAWTNHFTASADAGVDQPGDYHARLGIWPDSEQGADLPAKEVEVVLTVLPAPSMGMLRGVVNRDRPDGPLGAGLTFESTGGMTWTTATDPETGVYGYWLDAGDYQLTASAPGYISVTVPVQVAAGQTTTQDLVLLLLAPEIELAPSGLERALEIAGIATDTLTISNTGCLLLTFSLSHQDTPNATIETGGASWLATDPSNGSVAPGEAIDVEVAFDAAVVPEPGTYRADLDVRSNDPLAPEIMVPVTMKVLPGPELGRLEGTVLGLGYCDAEPSPVEAEVTVQSAAGMSKTLSSAADTGRYASWLPAGTYTVTALAVQHQSAQAAVVISAGMTETLDLRLRWHNSCMDLAPLSVSLDLAPGTRYTETLLLANSGAGDLVWQLRETVDASALNMMAPLADGSRQPSIEEAVVLREGFDGGEVPPPGWDLIQTNARQTWELAFDFAHEGDHSAFCDYDDLFGQQDEVLLSPALALESGVLGFWSSGDLYWCRDTLDHCDLNVWLVLGDWDGGLNDDVYVGRADDDWEHSGQWSFSRFDLDPFLPGGPVRVGFQYYGRDGERIGLDSVLLEGVEPGTWQDVPWVSVAPPSGTAPADGLDSVGVHFDATDLAVGACYTASLGLLHSDPGWENPAYVPLQLCVAPDSADVERQYLPLIVRSR